jgi:hypothetical protein
MPLAKFSCPKCKATLKPAKPVPEGKTVKCPKCQESFKAGEAPEDKAAVSKPAEDEDAGTYGVLKDPEEEKKEAERKAREERKLQKKKRKREDDDEDEEEDEDEDEEEEKEDILEHYLATVKSKDPRGPAQEAIVRPANWVLFLGILGFFGWIGYLVVFLIPIIFPTYEKEPDSSKEGIPAAAAEKEKGKEEKKFKFTADVFTDLKNDGSYSDSTLDALKKYKDKEMTLPEVMKKVKDDKIDVDDARRFKKYVMHALKLDKYQHFWSAITILDEDYAAWAVPLFLGTLIIGLAVCCLVCYGAFRMQSLESHQWGVISSILVMVPLVTVWAFVLVTFLGDLVDLLLDAEIEDYTWCFGLPFFLVGPLVGGICLKTLMDPKVKAGFEYKSD